MHAWIKMNENDKREEEEALSLFWILRMSPQALKTWLHGDFGSVSSWLLHRRGF